MLRSIKNILIFSSLFTFIFADAIPLGSSIPLPEIKMEDISGKKVSLNDVKMKNGLLVNFSCNTCPWVHAWQDRYNELAKAVQKTISVLLLLILILEIVKKLEKV